MKILLASKYGPHGKRPIGGVQTWVHTVRNELVKCGHEVVLYEGGQKDPQQDFDFGIFANWRHTGHLVGLCKRVLQVCHGIIDEEQPQFSNVAFTSEEVRGYWHGTGPVIRQPIDLEFWRPQHYNSGRFLTRHSYRRGLEFLPDVAKELKLVWRRVRNVAPIELRQVLQHSACVIATGRAALEAVACGAPVVICDHRSAYQGPLLDTDTIGSMMRNYSGRGGVEPNHENVKAEIQKAIATGSLRSHIEQHHDARKIVEELLCLCG